MIAFALTLAIPLVANLLLRSKLAAFVISAPLGVLVLWLNMVHNESRSPNSDLDIMFGFACVFWAVVLVCVYAVISIVFAIGARAACHRNAVKPASGLSPQPDTTTEQAEKTAPQNNSPSSASVSPPSPASPSK
jgi:hypothetical protein